MNEPAKVLMVVTSHDKIDEAHPTGLWLEEFAVPYLAFKRAGLDVTVASTKGSAARAVLHALQKQSGKQSIVA